MQLTTLGDYGGYPSRGIGTSGYLLTSGDYHLLLDCGSGVLLALEQVLDPLQLDAVLLSHYHHDHTADVGVLQYLWQIRGPKNNRFELPIWGPVVDVPNLEQLSWGTATKGLGYTAEQSLQLGPFGVTFLQTQHPVPAFAMRIQEESTGRILGFTADTAAFSGLATFFQGVDVLLSDTNFFADHTGVAWHLTAPESGKLAREALVPRLILTHLPQEGSLSQLVTQAQVAAGPDIKVSLPTLEAPVEI